MTCNIDKDLLHLYVDGNLDSIERMLLDEHLSICAICRRELNQLKVLDWDLKNETEIEVPAELKQMRQNLIIQLGEESGAKENKFEMKSVYQIQYNTLKNSFNFLNYLPGKNIISLGSKVKPLKDDNNKKTTLISRIIG